MPTELGYGCEDFRRLRDNDEQRLELIEAFHLFPVKVEQIEVVVHPQSVIHSLVAYVDGSVLAQLGQPDMRTPIAYALAWPDRMQAPARDCVSARWVI